MGEILRASVKSGAELGKAAQAYLDAGSLVPDDLVIAIVNERLQQLDNAAGFILDGFPRTTAQADALADQLDKHGRRITCAALLHVSDTEIVKRIAGRRVCLSAGHSFHIDYDPPKRPSVCDQDGSPLVQRDDDTPEVVQRRLQVYHEQTAPLVGYYSDKNLLCRVDGNASPVEVCDRILAAVTTSAR
jgi:adenylate kinase